MYFKSWSEIFLIICDFVFKSYAFWWFRFRFQITFWWISWSVFCSEIQNHFTEENYANSQKIDSQIKCLRCCWCWRWVVLEYWLFKQKFRCTLALELDSQYTYEDSGKSLVIIVFASMVSDWRILNLWNPLWSYFDFKYILKQDFELASMLWTC